MKELIKAQEEYIQFLLNEVRKLSVFASVHGMTCDEETYNKGIELCKNIEDVKPKKRCHIDQSLFTVSGVEIGLDFFGVINYIE